MSDAAEPQEVASEESATEDMAGLVPDQDLPNFDIYSEDAEEVQEQEGKEEASTGEDPKKDTWTAKIKKDREQRRRDIDFKKREQSLSQREAKLKGLESVREKLLEDPSGFLEAQGIDPLDFYSDWTDRIVSGKNEPSEKLRLSSTEKQLKELKQELIRRDRFRAEEQQEFQRNKVLRDYHDKIDSFKEGADDYPLTREQCTSADIAEGIGAYYQKTGIELGFDEAFKMIENGLREKEDEIFNDPTVIAKFKKHHGLDASNNKGRRSHLTLSSNLQAQPTKTPAEDMSEDEIYDFWKGKLFT